MQKEGAGKFGNHSTKGRLGGTARAGNAAATKAFRAARGAAGARRRAQAAESIAARAAAGAAALHGLHVGSAASDGDDDEPVLATPPRAAAHRPRAAASMGGGEEGEGGEAPRPPRGHQRGRNNHLAMAAQSEPLPHADLNLCKFHTISHLLTSSSALCVAQRVQLYCACCEGRNARDSGQRIHVSELCGSV
jgi:hypothetical protein